MAPTQENMYLELTLVHKLDQKQAVEAAFEGVKLPTLTQSTYKKLKRVGRLFGFTNKT